MFMTSFHRFIRTDDTADVSTQVAMGFLQAFENFAALSPRRAVGFFLVNVDIEQLVGL